MSNIWEAEAEGLFRGFFVCFLVFEIGFHYVDQTGLIHRDPSASASQVLGLKEYAIMLG